MVTKSSSLKRTFDQFRSLSQRSASHKSYSETLLLPKTSFPLRPNHVEHSRLRDANTQTLYDWQTQHKGHQKKFVFQDGPPYANGDLHIGHALNKILKDIINRHKMLNGHHVVFRPGWDCHGLPIELKVLQQRKTGEDLTIQGVRQAAHNLAADAVENQAEQFQNMGIMADWRRPYLTMDIEYETAQLVIFRDMVEKGMIFRANKPVYWSPSSKSALAEAELEYKEDHISHAAYVAFTIHNTGSFLKCSHQYHFLIWTTTPWTLPANRAIAINPDIEYCSITCEDGKAFIVAQSLAERICSMLKDGKIDTVSIPGRALRQLKYADCFSQTGSRPVLEASFVTADSGTGVVHCAPGHGQEDYLLCQRQATPIEVFSPVDDDGCYTTKVLYPELIGLDVQKNGSKKVIEMLQANGTLLKVEKYRHKYPYDWRTKQPVITRATPQFFCSLAEVKNEALTALNQINFLPPTGRSRLETFIDARAEWCISRQRAWGVPIPVLYDSRGEVLMTADSINHIIEILSRKGSDAWFEPCNETSWKEWVPRKYHGRGPFKRGTETLDVWFDSGCAWASSDSSVADIYLEGSDQHRGWFQSSLLTSMAVNSKAPYKNVVTHGFVLDSQGRKMSKSIGNVIDPLILIHGKPQTAAQSVPVEITDRKERRRLTNLASEASKEVKPLGADVLRLWVAQSDFTSDVSVSPTILSHVAESLRKIRTTIRYFLGNLHDFQPASITVPIDVYAVHKSSLFRQRAMQNYEELAFNKVVASINQFTNSFLSSFYFDTLKDRLYADNPASTSRQSAQNALSVLLQDYLLVLAPFCPFLVTETWSHLPNQIHGDHEHIYATSWSELRHQIPWTEDDEQQWSELMIIRSEVNKLLEAARGQKLITSSLQADVSISKTFPSIDLANLLIVSKVVAESDQPVFSSSTLSIGGEAVELKVHAASGKKCPRCWTYTSESEDKLCIRCTSAIA